jgi:hypothetical protein
MKRLQARQSADIYTKSINILIKNSIYPSSYIFLKDGFTVQAIIVLTHHNQVCAIGVYLFNVFEILYWFNRDSEFYLKKLV